MANYTSTANVVLSVNGKQAQQMLSTLQREAQNLEKKIAKAATAGQGTISLVIGGADGLPEEVKAACDYRLSFSPMTFPHQLMRVILLEQLYRALNINSNGNYHH